MAQVQIVRVFVNSQQEHGNPLGVFLHGREMAEGHRQRVAAELGYSETVFVDDRDRGVVRVFSPTSELPFAGHPLVGTAWLLARAGRTPSVLRPPAGDVPVWVEGTSFWLRGRTRSLPAWEHVQLESPDAVEDLRKPPRDEHDFTQFWAWLSEPDGTVRARVFAGRIGVPEDEACGSASMLLAHRLNRAITVRHGEGSLLRVRPGPDGTVELGGDVAFDGVREYQSPGG